MAWHSHRIVLPFTAASAIGAFRPVFQPIASSRDEVVVPAGTTNQDLLGLSIATVASALNDIAVVVAGVAKAVAGASLGAGARLTVGSDNGILVPIQASGVGSGAPAAVGPKYQIGKAVHAAAAGDTFSVLLQPEQIV